MLINHAACFKNWNYGNPNELETAKVGCLISSNYYLLVGQGLRFDETRADDPQFVSMQTSNLEQICSTGYLYTRLVDTRRSLGSFGVLEVNYVLREGTVKPNTLAV